MMQARLLFDTEAIKAYQALTFEEFRVLLKEPINEEDGFIPIGINLLGRPIAFLLAENFREIISVRSLFVAPAFRRQGLASRLLQTLQDYALANNCPRVSLEYVIECPTTAGIESLLAANTWSMPEDGMILCKIECKRVNDMLKTRWMSNYRLPPAFRIFPWSELGEQEFAQLENPSFYEVGHKPTLTDFEPMNSLGLRYRDEIVGWMLTKRRKTDILYDNLFIKQEFRKLGRAIPLGAAAIKLQYRHEGHLPNNHAIWQTFLTNKPMVRFIENHLAPFTLEIKKTRIAYKPLT